MDIGRIQDSYNNSIFTNKTDETVDVKQTGDGENSDFSNTVQGSELNLTGTQDTALRQLLAQKAAWQIQLDQFDSDQKMDGVINGHANNRETLKEEALTNQKESARLYGLIEEAKGSYCVEDDSTEQKDLELLQKQMLGKEPLTEDELVRITEMGPLTEYQKAALDYTSMVKIFDSRATAANEGALNESRTISAIKLELLKTHPMVDAKKDAEGMLKQVDEEIQQLLLEEIKKRVGENLDIDTDTQILTDPGALINQKKATEEDLKGLAVDEKV
jgi:hypothetical protein